MSQDLKKYWDHSTKPSAYVILIDEEEAFRGSFNEGIMYVKSLENDGMISFKEDVLPEWRKISKNLLRALTSEQGLRREIIKFKKEVKELISKVPRKLMSEIHEDTR
jgi:hypothetical protein